MSFTLLERKALLGMGAIAVFVGVSLYEIGKRNLWFESKITYQTHIKDADGLRVGSVVTIAGLRVGDVAALAVDPDNQIAVTLSVIKSVSSRVRKDSAATVFRAFIIGDKRIEIIPGSESEPELADGAILPSRETTELAEFITGKKLAELMGQVDNLILGITRIMSGVDDVMNKYDSGSFNKSFARIDPALDNFMKLSGDLITMTKELKTKSKQMPQMVEQGVGLLSDMREDIFSNHLARDTLANVNKVITPLATRQQLIEQVLGNVENLSNDLKNNPQFAQQMVDALKELTITLRALQKTWILEDQTKEVKSEGKK